MLNFILRLAYSVYPSVRLSVCPFVRVSVCRFVRFLYIILYYIRGVCVCLLFNEHSSSLLHCFFNYICGVCMCLLFTEHSSSLLYCFFNYICGVCVCLLCLVVGWCQALWGIQFLDSNKTTKHKGFLDSSQNNFCLCLRYLK